MRYFACERLAPLPGCTNCLKKQDRSLREAEMTDNPLRNPELQSLEARLASMPPRLGAGEQQQLLYQCAFAAGKAAGQRASGRVIRGWTAVTSILALLCVGLA